MFNYLNLPPDRVLRTGFGTGLSSCSVRSTANLVISLSNSVAMTLSNLMSVFPSILA